MIRQTKTKPDILARGFYKNILPDEYQETRDIKLKNYRLEKKLGSGSYAIVKYGIEKKTGNEYAIKIYEKYKLVEAHRRKNLRREIAIMNKLDHPSLIKLYHTIETKR